MPTAEKNKPAPPSSGPSANCPPGSTTPCPKSARSPATKAELLNDPTVKQAMQDSWNDSNASDPALRHEEGGWIYQNPTTGAITTRRASAGAQASLDLNNPPEVPGSVVVGKFHTHPNPTSEGWNPGPSRADTRNAIRHGVPSLIQADDGSHSTGPDSRRGGLGGGPGYPP